MIRIGIIGYGYWGPNLARNFDLNPGSRVSLIADSIKERRDVAANRHRSAKVVQSAEEVIVSDQVDAVAIVTPPSTHFALTSAAIRAGKHVVISKPMVLNEAEAEELIDLAETFKVTAMVDHTFLFSPAVTKLKEIIDTGELGDLLYFDSTRINLGLFQSDINVVWDLASHDLAVFDYLIGSPPSSLSCLGFDHYKTGRNDLAYLTLNYPGGISAHLHVSWLSPVKIRKFLVAGTKKMAVWDDLDADGKVKIYDRGIDIKSPHKATLLASYRVGDIHTPNLASDEPLTLAVNHFLECIANHQLPTASLKSGAGVVRSLLAADRSNDHRGAIVSI